jgi:hypothetical protein
VRTLTLLQKTFAEFKRQNLELSADIMLVSKAKDLFKEDFKVLNKAMSKVDNQLVPEECS